MKTNFKFSNKLFVVALTMLMAICLSCIVGFTYLTASAATGDTIGLGKEKSATVEVTYDSPATFTVSKDVKEGSYLFMADVTNLPAAQLWDITFSLQSPDEEYFLPYNAYVGGYTSVVTVEPGMDLTLSLYNNGYDLTVEAYLDYLYIGPANEYWLSGIQIMEGQSSTINLQDVPAGDYIASAEIIAGELEEEATMSIQVDTGTALPMAKNANMYGAYTANIAITENSTTLTLSTTNESVVAINFTLKETVKTTPLPTTTAEEFTSFEARTYEYTATKTGFQTLVPTATPSASDFAIIYKTNANNSDGESLQGENYPIYMVKGQTYYFTVMYLGFDGNGTIKFAVEDWKAPTLYLNTDVVYAPVMNNGIIGAIDVVVDEASEYQLSLVNVAYWDAEIILHHGTETVSLNSNNNFTVVTEFATTSEIYFTTDYSSSFAVAVSLSYGPRQYDNRIVLDTDVTIELNVDESLVYYVGYMVGEGDNAKFVGITNGNYTVTLTGANGQVVIYDANYYTTVVANGASTGMFSVLLDYPNDWGYPGETSRQQPLLIENYGTTELTFTIRITKATGYDLTLGTAKQITLAAESNVTYFLAGLDSGSYVVTVGGTHTNIVVYNLADRNSPLVSAGADFGMYSFTLAKAYVDTVYPENSYPAETSRTIALNIQNVGYTSETFEITVIKVNSLELDTAKEITLTANQRATYYIGNLVSGTYLVTLEGADGVTVEGAGYSDGKLIVNATADKYTIAALTFTASKNVTFTVTITETVDGTMEVGTPQKIQLSYYDDTQTYEIYLTAGNYEITIANVESESFFGAYYMVAIDGNYIIYGDTSAYFEILESGMHIVTFMTYDYDMLSFDATITEVASEDFTMMLGVAKEITLSAGESKTYYIELTESLYMITLTLPNGTEIQVNVSTMEEPAIPFGEVEGYFEVISEDGGAATIALTFTYNGEGETTFTAMVTEL